MIATVATVIIVVQIGLAAYLLYLNRLISRYERHLAQTGIHQKMGAK